MIRPGPEKHGVWPNLSLDNALLILGVIAMLEKTLIDLAALVTIAQFVLDLWRGRKTRPEDADDKRTASSWNY